MMEKKYLVKGDTILITNEHLENYGEVLTVDQNETEDEAVLVEEGYGATLLYFYEDFMITQQK